MLRVGIKRKRKPYIKFKRYMESERIPQKDIAVLLGKSVSAVNQNLNGTGCDFFMEEIRMICKKYKLSADEYFSLNECFENDNNIA